MSHFGVGLPSMAGSLFGSIFSLGSAPGKSVESGGFQSGLACFTDGLAAAFVFVVGGDVADAGVQPDRVVVAAGDAQLGPQGRRVADREQVRVLAFEVPVEALDPGLVG